MKARVIPITIHPRARFNVDSDLVRRQERARAVLPPDNMLALRKSLESADNMGKRS